MGLRGVARLAAGLLLAFFALEALRVHWADQRLQPSPAAIGAQVFADSPVQTATDAAPFVLHGYRVRPLAAFALRARVLGRENYYFGREADLSATDLALGWKRMADPAVYQRLNVSQGGRWFYYSWRGAAPPIPEREIIESAANMHMIAASPEVARALARVRAGDWVRITGLLVEASDPASGWRWSSSLSRSDSGAGACELVYVQALQIG